MPRIPLASFSPSATPQATPRADPGMNDPLLAGGRAIGQGVASIGAVVGDFAMRKQEAVNYATMADADLKMKEAFSNFQNDIQKNGDEKTWMDDWQKRSSELEQNLGINDMPQAVREKMLPQLASWKQTTDASVRSQVTAREISRAKAQVTESAEMDLKLGDIANYTAKIQGGEKHGLFSPEEATSLVESAKNKSDYYHATSQITASPVDAVDTLSEKTDSGRWKNYPELNENQRLTLLNEARATVSKNQRDNYQSLIDGVKNGVVTPDDQLQAMVDGKLLTATQRNAYLKAYAHGNPTTDPVKIGTLLSDIHNYDPSKDPDYSKQGALLARIATGGFPQNVQTQADALMKEKANPDSVLNTDVAKDSMRYIDQAFNMEVFGKYKKPKVDENGKPYLDPVTFNPVIEVNQADYAKASELRARVQGGLTQFLRDNPKATPEQAQKYITGFVMGDVQKAGASTLFATPKPSITSSTDDAAAKRDKLNSLLKSLSQ